MKKLIAIALALSAGTAAAEFYDGNELLRRMNSTVIVEEMIALGYVMGVADAVRDVDYCGSPDNATAGQFRDIVRNYLTRNPQHRHHTADLLVRVALASVWPCKRSTPSPGGRTL
jgi:hypothetical protein